MDDLPTWHYSWSAQDPNPPFSEAHRGNEEGDEEDDEEGGVEEDGEARDEASGREAGAGEASGSEAGSCEEGGEEGPRDEEGRCEAGASEACGREARSEACSGEEGGPRREEGGDDVEQTRTKNEQGGAGGDVGPSRIVGGMDAGSDSPCGLPPRERRVTSRGVNLERRPPASGSSAEATGPGKEPLGAPRPRLTRLPRAGTVIFDCDSTLSVVEGIEEIAREHQREIERLTAAAMDGIVPLEDVYGRRLELVRPDRACLDALGRRYVETLVPDTRATIDALRAEGLAVRVISGGLLPSVRALAAALDIPAQDVAAVDVRFDAHGAYADYDVDSPLARAGGKAEILRAWRHETPGPHVLVGDGATDLEARDAVDVFIAFAGVADRPAVTAAADAVVRARSLAPVVPLALGGAAPRGSVDRAVYDRGLALLDDAARAKLDPTLTNPDR
jgi:phosphoserine phosphatase